MTPDSQSFLLVVYLAAGLVTVATLLAVRRKAGDWDRTGLLNFLVLDASFLFIGLAMLLWPIILPVAVVVYIVRRNNTAARRKAGCGDVD